VPAIEHEYLAPEPRSDGGALSREAYERYLPLVRRVALRTAQGTLPTEVGYDEVLRAGFQGLVSALNKNASAPEPEFEAYAAYRIRLSVLEFLKLRDPHARQMRESSLRISSAIHTLWSRTGRTPSEKEVADSMGLGLDTYRELLTQIFESGWVRLELTTENDAQVGAFRGRDDMLDKIGRVIGNLPEQYQVVLGLYYQEQCSHPEIAEILGLETVRACQLHAQAVHLVRGQLQAGLAS
jgi:RNA polymerase sigma factor FliA